MKAKPLLKAYKKQKVYLNLLKKVKHPNRKAIVYKNKVYKLYK